MLGLRIPARCFGRSRVGAKHYRSAAAKRNLVGPMDARLPGADDKGGNRPLADVGLAGSTTVPQALGHVY